MGRGLGNSLEHASISNERGDGSAANAAAEAWAPGTEIQTTTGDGQHLNRSRQERCRLPGMWITGSEVKNADKIADEIAPKDNDEQSKTTAKNADISPDGVVQGDNGDCFFEAGLASLAATPEGQASIQKMVTKNDNGSYTVRFPGDVDNPISVNQDDLISDGGSENPNRTIEIVETAFLKYGKIGQYGSGLTSSPLSYERVPIFGPVTTTKQALELLTGKQTAVNVIGGIAQNFDVGFANPANIASFMQNALNNGEPVIATSNLTFAGPISSRHVYSVLGFDSETGTVTVRNPWGTNDGTAVERKNSTVDGVTNIGDGQLTMPLGTFMKLFKNVAAAGVGQIENQFNNVANDVSRHADDVLSVGTNLLDGNFNEAGESALSAIYNSTTTFIDTSAALVNTGESLFVNALNALIDW